MTARPIDPESRRRPLQITVALVLVMVVVLLAAGWGSQSFPAPLTLFNSYNHTPYFMTGILKRESFQHE